MGKAIRETSRRLAWWFIYSGPRRDITLDTLNGRLTFDSKDWLIGKYLYVKRSYEASQIESAMSLLRQGGYLRAAGGTVVDVGANIGMISVHLLKHGCFSRALAFEPAPNSYRLLVQNVNQNGFAGRILSFPCALSSSEGEIELELSTDNSGDHRLRGENGAGFFRERDRQTVKVQASTLDKILAQDPALSSEPVALVWLDIQGYEGHFFKGAMHLLKRGVPVVSEFWPYAIERSGMSRPEFCRITADLFTHFYTPGSAGQERFPIAELGNLFDLYSAPREMCSVVLVRDPVS